MIQAQIHDELLLAQKQVFDKCGLSCTDMMAEAESAEYGAAMLKINGLSARFRVARITPAKTGLFVTIWKRNGNGPIEPFHITDNLDLVLVSVRNGERSGQFIFPKQVLADKGIISVKNREGKRGIRVYPPWDKVSSKQAEKTQEWQALYFLDTSAIEETDILKAKKLFAGS